MAWDENWRDADRMDASKLQYSLFPNKQAWKIFAYFTILPILTFTVLSSIGKQPAMIAGWPLLLWIAIAITLSYVIGLYILIRVPERNQGSGADGEVTE